MKRTKPSIRQRKIAALDKKIEAREKILHWLYAERKALKQAETANQKVKRTGINSDRYREAWRLRDRGMVFRKIGEKLGVSAGRARELVFGGQAMAALGFGDKNTVPMTGRLMWALQGTRSMAAQSTGGDYKIRHRSYHSEIQKTFVAYFYKPKKDGEIYRESEVLGEADDVENAKAICERHFAETK